MNNVANINDVSNSVKATPSILHCGTPVITTGIMAKLYGTDEANVKMNFSRNADRFIEGKHYFKLEGVELKGFKDRVTESYPVKFHDQIVGKRARSLTLWTERGAARHAKMLDTDQAWDVFEALEDFYFTKKDNSQRKAKQIAGRITSEQQEAIKQLVLNRGKALPKEKQAKAMITMWSSLKSHFGCTYKEIDSDKFTEALSLAARVPLEGEYLPKQDVLPTPKLEIDYPLTWYPDNFPFVDMCFYKNGQLKVTQSMLTETKSPSREILSKLENAGYDVTAAKAEIESLRHTMIEMSWALGQIASFAKMKDVVNKTFTA
ncbi:ORF6N domain-containing protein [Providencia rettgeri]|nr:ORF6N domain-containing protein [Providencia rettgeri]ELR5165037.1 ORF6N domain-containing protein [Providencia rettgeri]